MYAPLANAERSVNGETEVEHTMVWANGEQIQYM